MIPLLIDTDPGIDDALALLLAWGSPEAAVVAVTTVAGNVPLDAATRNLDRLLALRRPTPPPRVGIGAAAPLARPLVTAEHYHGADGLGDLAGWPPSAVDPSRGAAPRPHAVDLILATAVDRGADLTVLAIGPLTNVALALEADRARLASVGRLVVMGGAVDVPGNVTPTAEFNFHVDPEAAARVFAAGLALDLVPLDATRQAVVTRPELLGALGGVRSGLGERVAAFTERAFRAGQAGGDAGIVLHDPLAVGVAIDPGIVEWEHARLEIGPDGETRRAPGPPNCRIARTVDAPRFRAMLLARLTAGATA